MQRSAPPRLLLFLTHDAAAVRTDEHSAGSSKHFLSSGFVFLILHIRLIDCIALYVIA